MQLVITMRYHVVGSSNEMKSLQGTTLYYDLAHIHKYKVYPIL